MSTDTEPWVCEGLRGGEPVLAVLGQCPLDPVFGILGYIGPQGAVEVKLSMGYVQECVLYGLA